MAFTFAGQYTEAILATGASGATLLPALPAHVYTVGTTTHVTLYTSRTKGTTTANPVTTDVNGNLTFFVDPGQYDIVFTPVGGTQKRVTVTIPADPAEASATYVAFLSPSGGDDTAQIMAAYNAALASGTPGVVRLGAGTFTVNTAADGLTWASSAVSLVGAGKDSTVLVGGANTTSSVLNITVASGGHFADFAVSGQGVAAFAIKQSLAVETSVGTRFERVFAHGATTFQWENQLCEDNTYIDCSTSGNEGAPTTVAPAMRLNIPFGLARIIGGELFGTVDVNAQVIEAVGSVIGPVVVRNASSLASTVLKLDGCYLYDGGAGSAACISSADHFTHVSANGCYFVAQTNRNFISGDIPAGVTLSLRNCNFVWGPGTAGTNNVVSASGSGAVVIDGYGSSLGSGTLSLFNPVSSATTAVKVRSATKATGPAQNLKSGGYQFLGGSVSTGTSAAMGVGTFRIFPVWIDTVVTLTRIGLEVTAIGDVGSKVRLGIYADDGSGYPGARISDCGQIAGDSATVQELTISVTLVPGLYWFGATVQNVTTTQPTVRTWVSNYPFSPAYNALPPTNANPTGYASTTAFTAALPATFDAWSGNVSGTMPHLFVKAS